MFEPTEVDILKVMDMLEKEYFFHSERWDALRKLLETQKAAQHVNAPDGANAVCMLCGLPYQGSVYDHVDKYHAPRR